MYVRPLQIGSTKAENNILLAPMAGITDLPFRIVAKRFGWGLVWTEMVSAAGLVHRSKKTIRFLRSHPTERPLVCQIFGAKVDIMEEGARIAQGHGIDLIDINMGCPARKVNKTGSGAALMRSPQLVFAIVSAVRKASEVPLTVKIRAGWDAESKNAVEIATVCEEAGADAVTVHPRTAMQGFGPGVHWPLIGEVKERVTIPVIGNGDITDIESAKAVFDETGCDGIMIGRAAKGRPWLYRQIRSGLDKRGSSVPISLKEMEQTMFDHLSLARDLLGLPAGMWAIKKHLGWYARELPFASTFRARVQSLHDLEAIRDEIRRLFDTARSENHEDGPHHCGL